MLKGDGTARMIANGRIEIEQPKYCIECGQKSKKYIETWSLPKNDKYIGNGRVLSQREKNINSNNGYLEVRVTRDLWVDFEYGYFCKARCAIAFANCTVNGFGSEGQKVLIDRAIKSSRDGKTWCYNKGRYK